MLYNILMKDAKSDYLRNIILTTYLQDNLLGLMDEEGNEIEGATDYERMPIEFNIADNLAKNSNEIVFQGVSNIKVYGWRTYDEAGRSLYRGIFKQPFEIGPTGDLTIIKESIEIEER